MRIRRGGRRIEDEVEAKMNRWYKLVNRNLSAPPFTSTLEYLYWWTIFININNVFRMYKQECEACGNFLDKVQDNLAPETFIGLESAEMLMGLIYAGMDPSETPEYNYLDDVLRSSNLVGPDNRLRNMKPFRKLFDRSDLWTGREKKLMSIPDVSAKTGIPPRNLRELLFMTPIYDSCVMSPTTEIKQMDLIVDFEKFISTMSRNYIQSKYEKQDFYGGNREMMCYRDITFCSFWEECKDGRACLRALVPEIIFKAEKAGMDIAQFLDKPKCFKQREVSDGYSEDNSEG